MSTKQHQLDPQRTEKLERLAKQLNRSSEELLNEAVDNYWDEDFIQDVRAGMAEADAGDFATEDDIRALNKKYGLE